MSNDFKIAPYSDSQKDNLFNFFKQVFPENYLCLDKKKWQWLYFGHEYLIKKPQQIFLFTVSQQIVGHLGAIPVELKIQESECVASWGIDIMVQQDYRNAGIGAYLIRAWDESTPVSLSLGVTGQALEVFESFGRTYVGEIPVYKKIISPEKIIQRKLKSKLLAWLASQALKVVDWIHKAKEVANEDLVWEELNSFDESINDLWDETSSDYPFIIARKKDYLNWRVFSQPEYKYSVFKVTKNGKLKGYVVLDIHNKDNLSVGYIADIFCIKDEQVVNFIIQKSVKFFTQNKVDLIECLMTDPFYVNVLNKFRFWKRETHTRLLFNVNDENLSNNFTNADKMDNWFITFLDSDCLLVMQ